MNPKDICGKRKPSLSYVPMSALLHCAKAAEHGAKKYGKLNWRDEKIELSVYLDAIIRHVMQIMDGEEIDDESNQLHAAHIMCTAAIIIDALETKNLIKDVQKGKSPDIIKRFTTPIEKKNIQDEKKADLMGYVKPVLEVYSAPSQHYYEVGNFNTGRDHDKEDKK